jgi:hypothetical protein
MGREDEKDRGKWCFWVRKNGMVLHLETGSLVGKIKKVVEK